MLQHAIQSTRGRFLTLGVLLLMVGLLPAATCLEYPSRSSGSRWAVVVYCGEPGLCLPWPQEWGASYESNKVHIHNVESSSSYYRNLHQWKQVMWFNGLSGRPYGILYSMFTQVQSTQYGNLGNTPIRDSGCKATLAPGDTLITGCFNGSAINLGKPGGEAAFHAGWAAVGPVIPPSADVVDYISAMHHRYCHSSRCGVIQ